jgi:hypothetical protein
MHSCPVWRAKDGTALAGLIKPKSGRTDNTVARNIGAIQPIVILSLR